MGYICGKPNSQSCNWLQYADDAVLIAKDQKCAQGLANIFDACCSWAHMDIRIDKCCSFGMAKKETRQVQILPNISVKAGQIPPTEIGGHFKYLGKYFDFKMDGSLVKSEILTNVELLLKTTSALEIKPQTKLKIFDRFIPTQINFYLRLYNFPSTWVVEQLDALCIRHIRQWVEAPVSSCISELLVTPNRKCGMGIPSFKNRFERLQLSKRSALKTSQNESIRDLWNDTTLSNVSSDSLLIS